MPAVQTFHTGRLEIKHNFKIFKKEKKSSFISKHSLHLQALSNHLIDMRCLNNIQTTRKRAKNNLRIFYWFNFTHVHWPHNKINVILLKTPHVFRLTRLYINIGSVKNASNSKPSSIFNPLRDNRQWFLAKRLLVDA